MLGSTLLQPEVPKARLGLRPENLGLPNPIANGKNKGLEEDGKMMPKDLPPSEDQHPMVGHRACQKGKRDARDMTKAAK